MSVREFLTKLYERIDVESKDLKSKLNGSFILVLGPAKIQKVIDNIEEYDRDFKEAIQIVQQELHGLEITIKSQEISIYMLNQEIIQLVKEKKELEERLSAREYGESETPKEYGRIIDVNKG